MFRYNGDSTTEEIDLDMDDDKSVPARGSFVERKGERWTLQNVEARVGFEPTNGGFADLSLGPLGYRAKRPSIANYSKSVRATPGKIRKSNLYFFSAGAGAAILASRKNLAASSGGVGLM